MMCSVTLTLFRAHHKKVPISFPQVMRNLHVVFTMNPSSEGLKDRAATSPALFNRCVLNWFGDWSTSALYQVGLEFTNKVDLDKSNVREPSEAIVAIWL